MKNPYKICYGLEDKIQQVVDQLLTWYGPGADDLKAKFASGDAKLYVTNTRRGRCTWTHDKTKFVITVPRWAYTQSYEFFMHYVAHELSHAVSLSGKHNKKFYEVFRTLCPVELQHYELDYKPSARKWLINV